MKTLLTDCHLISPDCDLRHAAVLLEDKTIRRIFPAGDALPAADRKIDLQNQMVMPGFIDVHCHGRNGSDFSDGDADGITAIARAKLAEGVTGMLPTSLTLGTDTLLALAAAVRKSVDSGNQGCKFPGIHLEGPYINPACLGAQNPAFVRSPDIDEVLKIHAVYPVCKVSYAVEMKGGAEFAAQLIANGITPSCVHSKSTYAEFLPAYEHGLRNLSHFCNQMTALHHRDIGLVGAGLLHKDLFIEVICDKIHLCADMLKLLFSLKDAGHIQIITDALRCSGMPDGDYTLGGMPFTLRNGEARLPGGNLAGSTLTMNRGLKNIYEVTGLPLKELVKCSSWNQACALHLPGVGRIEPGYAADLAVLNEDFEIELTMVDGEIRYRR